MVVICVRLLLQLGFPGDSAGKESACNAGDLGSIAGWGRSPSGKPLQYSCLENPMDRGAWWAMVRGVAKSWTWLRWQHVLIVTIRYLFLIVWLKANHLMPSDLCPLLKPAFRAKWYLFTYTEGQISVRLLCVQSNREASPVPLQTDPEGPRTLRICCRHQWVYRWEERCKEEAGVLSAVPKIEPSWQPLMDRTPFLIARILWSL